MACTADLSTIRAEVCKHCRETDFMLEGPRQLFICECCQLGAVRSLRQDFLFLKCCLARELKAELTKAIAEPLRVRGARFADKAFR